MYVRLKTSVKMKAREFRALQRLRQICYAPARREASGAAALCRFRLAKVVTNTLNSTRGCAAHRPVAAAILTATTVHRLFSFCFSAARPLQPQRMSWLAVFLLILLQL